MKKSILLVIVLLVFSSMVKAQPVISDPFFDHTDFIGAFGTSDWTDGWCEWEPQNKVYPAATITIPAGAITANTTWTSNNTYLLNGWVYLKSGVTLTIQPGTIIRGDYVNKGSLIVERGARLIAQGTAAAPIVFTSNEEAGLRDYGDWGGVILCGRARINQVGDTAEIEGGVGSIYGGGASPVDNDNSGILEYVRIEFAGVPYVTDKEINGLTMAGVGSGTTIDHVQVSYSGDDAFEWFGGKVNCKHLVSFRTWDDDFDTDNGYQGMVQYAVALRDPAIADPGSKSNGFESDNDKDGTTNTPQTAAIFSNVSMFGPKVTPSTVVSSNYKAALHLRRNTSLNIYNAFFAGYTDGLLLDGSLTEANATAQNLNIEFCMMAGITGQKFVVASGSTYDLASWYMNTMECNDTLSQNSDLMVSDGFNLNHPGFLPVAGSPLLNRPWLDCAAGVSQENLVISSLKAYPNPADEMVSVEADLQQECQLRLVLSDLTGRVLYETSADQAPGHQTITFNTAGLDEGLYVLTLSTPAQKRTQKMMVIH